MGDWRYGDAHRERPADVEDSIQYLRRYLGEKQEDNVEGSPQRWSMSPSRGKGDETVATGVLPVSAVSGEWRAKWEAMSAAATPGAANNSLTGGNPSWGGTSSTLHRPRSPREHGNDGNENSPLGVDNLAYTAPSLSNEKSGLREERYRFSRDRDSRGASPMREPLRLYYGSTAQTPVGRPPLHQQRPQEETETLTGRGSGVGWREDKVISPRREIRSSSDPELRLSDSRITSRNSYGSRWRGAYSDPYDRAYLNYYHRHRPGNHSNNKISIYESEDERVPTFSVTERVMALRGETGTGISQRQTEHSPGKGSMTKERITGISTRGASDSNGFKDDDDGCIGSVSFTKQQSALNRQLAPSETHDASFYSSREVFPYPVHDDNMRSIIFYLKNHYAMEERENLRGIQTMTPEDVLGLAQCFYVDMYRTVRHARDVAGVGRAGFTDRDPDVDCVLGSSNNHDLEPLPNPTQQSRRSEANSEVIERREMRGLPPERLSISTPPPPPPPTATTLRANSVRVLDEPQPSPPQQIRDWGGGPLDITRATRTPLHSVHWEQTTSAIPTHDVANGSQHTIDTTSFLLEAPMEPRSGIARRPLRALMPLLRRGSTLCKHVAGGRPHMRFFRVVDQLGEDRNGQSAIMPHLVWYNSAPCDQPQQQPHKSDHNQPRPNGALSLPSLTGVHLLSGDSASDSMRRLFRRSQGVVVDHRRRSVAEGMCAIFRFEERDVAVSFLTEADRQVWVGGLMAVVERNRELATQL